MPVGRRDAVPREGVGARSIHLQGAEFPNCVESLPISNDEDDIELARGCQPRILATKMSTAVRRDISIAPAGQLARAGPFWRKAILRSDGAMRLHAQLNASAVRLLID